MHINVLKLSIILILLNISVVIIGQPIVVNQNGVYKYFIGTGEPDLNWLQKDYNDDSWTDGEGSIGYGYEDLGVEIIQTTSLYLRIPFEVDDLSLYKDLSLRMFFEDGFVAYLNGTEVARLYMGEKNSETTYDQLADRSLEALISKCYLIDSLTVNDLLTEGKNVLAIEIHNDSINGSDLMMKSYLYRIDREYYSYGSSGYKYMVQKDLDSTLLPIVVVNTDEIGVHKQNIDYTAQMGIIYRGDSLYNHPDDTFNVYNGLVSLEIRGRSSRDFPKKSYNVETIDINGDALDVSILGLPEDNDFVLFAPFADRSLFRNPLVFDIGRELGEWHPRSKLCEIVYNGEYVGVYSFMEKIKRGNERLDIAKLNPDETYGVDLTGGYIFRIEGGGAGSISVYYPKAKNIAQEQTSYIHSYYNKYISTVLSNDFLDPVGGYWRYADIESMVDYIIMNEFTKNCDAYMLSFFMNKDKDDNDGRIKFGPLWDFDLCFGNATFQNGHLTSGWQFAEPTNNSMLVKRLFQDTELVNDFQNRWSELREDILHLDTINKKIDIYVQTLGEARQRNYETWPILNGRIFGNSYIPATYEEEIQIIKNWIFDRVTWIDENIGDIYYDLYIYTAENFPESETGKKDLQVYPNPFNSVLNIEFVTNREGQLDVELIDLYGRNIYIPSVMNAVKGNNSISISEEIQGIPEGIYMLNLIVDNHIVKSKKVLKK